MHSFGAEYVDYNIHTVCWLQSDKTRGVNVRKPQPSLTKRRDGWRASILSSFTCWRTHFCCSSCVLLMASASGFSHSCECDTWTGEKVRGSAGGEDRAGGLVEQSVETRVWPMVTLVRMFELMSQNLHNSTDFNGNHVVSPPPPLTKPSRFDA